MESIVIGGNEEIGQVASATRYSVGSFVDADFLEKLQNGDAEAFDVLVNRYAPDVFAFLNRLTENQEEAGDLTQETFLKAFRFVKNFRGDSDLKTWLFRIAINESKNRKRWWQKRQKDFTVSIDDEIGNSEKNYNDKILDKGETPEAQTLRHEREKMLRLALQKLPQIYREAVILRDIEGLSYDEIADALETNVGTVKSRISRGRDELKIILKGLDF